jgi:UDP-N-acetyl-D-mannosaminuronic acid dehydrogenase
VEIAHLIAQWHVGETWVVEPNVRQLPKSLAGYVTLKDTATALQQADVLVMLVDHHQFKAIKPEEVAQPWIVDTKGVWR